jgi:glycosyltransferase involved in cell wall biosynthesis
VIVAQGDGTQDDLVRVENGWQVTPGDQIAFTAALKDALMDPLELRRKGNESYRIVKEEINLDLMVNKFIDILRVQDKIVG